MTTQYKERCRDARGFAALSPLHGIRGDVRHSVRRLLATPQFLLFAVLSLAVGIGVTTAVYSVLYSLMWKPLGMAASDRVAFVDASGPGVRFAGTRMSRLDFEDLRAGQTSFRTLAASAGLNQPMAGPGSSEFVEGEAVSGEYFDAAGVKAWMGRMIQPQDDEKGAAVVVLNHRTWRTKFQEDPAIVGQIVRLGSHPFEVIGVAPPTFEGIFRLPRRTGAWIPLGAMSIFETARPSATAARERRQLTVFGRLARDRTLERASAELAAIGSRLDAAYPIHVERMAGSPQIPDKRRWSARSAADATRSPNDARMGATILTLVGLVLVVACMNLANLMLARGGMRQQEFAVRRALGASRWRLVRELCVESALVAALGGIFGVLLARVLLVLATADLPLPRGTFSIEPQMNLAALFVASVAVMLSMLVFGVEPALQLTRASVTSDLAGGTGAVGVPRSRRQRAFIRWQVAISATFFLIAAILAKVVVMEARHDGGVDVDRLAIASVHFRLQGWDEARARRALTTAADILRRERDVDSVAISTGVPFGMTLTPYATLTTPDKPFIARARYESASFIAGTPEIFRTLGVPIVHGRPFDDRDDAAAARVMVVSENTARTLFGSTTGAMGRQVMLQFWDRPPVETFTVVGVARDTSPPFQTRLDDTVYVPFAQHYEPNLVVVARTPGDPAGMARVIQTGLRRADPDLGTGTAGPASFLMSGVLIAARIAASLVTALGLLTLILAMAGLYGVQSHIVARRTREVGVRMALGASARQIQGMVLREGFRPVAEGVMLGLLLGTITRFAMRGLVNAAIQPVDPIALALVPIPLFAAAFFACYLPARRAARVAPNVALRHL